MCKGLRTAKMFWKNKVEELVLLTTETSYEVLINKTVWCQNKAIQREQRTQKQNYGTYAYLILLNNMENYVQGHLTIHMEKRTENNQF